MPMRVVWPDDPAKPKLNPRTGASNMPRKRKPTEPQDLENPQASPPPAHDNGHPHPTDEVADGQVEPTVLTAEEADDIDDGQGGALPDVDLPTLESLLFSTHHPLTPQRLADLLDVKSPKAIRKAVLALNERYEESQRSFRVEQVAGGYQMLSLPQFGDILKKLHQKEIDSKLTKAALETLAIIAYKQPILRADVEAIRGVACGETIRSLMEKHLVKIAGRAEEPGRPILYGTTRRFLELFGLNTVKDLPQSEALPVPKN